MSLETYQNMMAELGRACGFSLPVDDTGYTSLEVDGSLICNIQYIEPADAAYIYFEIGRIVAGGEGKVAPELLAGNLFGLGTGGGVLAMEPESRKGFWILWIPSCGRRNIGPIVWGNSTGRPWEPGRPPPPKCCFGCNRPFPDANRTAATIRMTLCLSCKRSIRYLTVPPAGSFWIRTPSSASPLSRAGA